MFNIGDVVKLTGTVKDVVKGNVLILLAVPDAPAPLPVEYWAQTEFAQSDPTVVAGSTPGSLTAAPPPPPPTTASTSTGKSSSHSSHT
ncbi:MAG: hypothetical protein HRJ53_00805 [Acidobacteria bacterium Pan2503]|uniref:Uncharacterized protein n=1 Tax=Candidatus Acidiferrum panamense TaxID=2741543 RepID=A0A7V8NLG2_9BACT|nr:hypothetical protein [Candidatus Acidoferrum panamensis]